RKQRDARIAELDKQISDIIDAQVEILAKKLLPQTAKYLLAATDRQKSSTDRFTPDPALLQQWIDYLGFGEFKMLANVIRDLSNQPGFYAMRNASNADTPSSVVNTTDH